jgi:hypothetical protein
MPPSESALRYRPTALDQALASERTIAVVGPVVGLDPDRIRANLVLAQDSTPRARIALTPRTDGRPWHYRSGVAELIAVQLSALNTDDLGRLLTDLHDRPGQRGPLDVLICGEYLVVDYSHGMGDGQLGVMLMAALSGEVNASRAGAVANGLPRNATWSALWRHYRSRPAAVKDLVALRRRNKQLDGAGETGRREVRESDLAKQCRSAHMAPATVAELRGWAKSQGGQASTASVTVALWMAALQRSGLTVDDQVTMLVNCRRYLDRKHVDDQGNFAVALPITLPPPQTPAAISEAVQDVIDSGWPIAILGMAELKSLVRRGDSPPAAESTTVPGRLRIAVSDLGRLGMYEHTVWASGRPPQLAAYLEPAAPDTASLLVSELAGGRTFTATFCGGVIDAATIEAALSHMCNDPVGTLENAQR